MPRNRFKGLNVASRNSYDKVLSKPGRVDLIPQEFETLIEHQGTRVRITPTALCPNRTDLGDTNHKLDCPICFGDEVIDIPSGIVEDWAYIQAIKLDKKFEVQGIWDMKDAQITVRQGVRLYYWYKIEVVDFSSVYNQIVKKSSGDSDELRYIPSTNCDTPYYLIDSNGKSYTLNEHYRTEGKNIKWRTALRPITDTLFTIVYPILPTFRVLEMMHENRFYYLGFKQPVKRPVQLPQSALIRWDYLAKRSGSNIPT